MIPKLIFVGCETGQYGDDCLPCEGCEKCEINSGLCGKFGNEKEQSNENYSNGIAAFILPPIKSLGISNFYKYLSCGTGLNKR